MKLNLVIATVVLALSQQVNAQGPVAPTTAPSTTLGSASTAPATLDFKFGKLADASKWLIRRIHTANVETRIQEMIANGQTHSEFLLGVSVQGAAIYNYEIAGDELSNWDETGRDAGFQVLPFSINFYGTDRAQISVNLVSWRNMNALQNSKNKFNMNGNHNDYGDPIWRVLDQLDIMKFSWDRKVEFNRVESFNLEIVGVKLRAGLASSPRGNYIAIRAGGSVGARWQQFQNNSPPLYDPTVTYYDDGVGLGGKGGFLGRYYGGLEGNIQNRKGMKVNLQSNYQGGGGQVYLHNMKIDEQNTLKNQNYNSAVAQYQSEASQYTLDIAQYQAAYNTYLITNPGVTAETYSLLTGNPKPLAPTKLEENSKDEDPRDTFIRSYGYIRNSADVSFPINKNGRPMRLGFGAEYNIPLYDQSLGQQKSTGTKLNFKDTSTLYGKVYLKF